MTNRVVHFEIPCDDPAKNIEFFSKVFGWNFQRFGNENYWTVVSGDEKQPGINGGLMKRLQPGQPVVNSIQVTDIDAVAAQIEKAGGTIVVVKMAIPGVGYSAYFKDPDGNIHGIYQHDPAAR